MPFCPYCGNEITYRTDSCPYCRQKITVEKSSPIQENISFSDFIRELEYYFPNRVIDLSLWNHQRWDTFVNWYCNKYNCTINDFFSDFHFVVNNRNNVSNSDEYASSKIRCPKCGKITPSIGKYCGYCGKRLNNKTKRDIDETKQQRENITNDKALTYDVKGILSFITMLIGIILVILSFCINECYFLFIPGVLVAIVGFIWWISEIAKAKCPECNSKNVVQISNVKTGEDYSTRTKKVEEKVYTNYDNSLHHGYNPTYTIEKEVSVPVTVHHYKVKYKCNDCGCVFTRNEVITTEN